MKTLSLLFVLLSLVLAGCAVKRLPSEDIEAPRLNSQLIGILKDPQLKANSKEKYDAIRALTKKVDFTFTRETKTINEYLSRRGLIKQIDATYQRGFTCSRRADDRNDIAFMNFYVHIPKRNCRGIFFSQMLDTDHFVFTPFKIVSALRRFGSKRSFTTPNNTERIQVKRK